MTEENTVRSAVLRPAGPPDLAQLALITGAVLARLDQGSATMMQLRDAVPHEIAGGFMRIITSLVRTGEITAIGFGRYARVPHPPGMPVRSAPIRDILLECLSITPSAREIMDYTGLGFDQMRGNLDKLSSLGMTRRCAGGWTPSERTLELIAQARRG